MFYVSAENVVRRSERHVLRERRDYVSAENMALGACSRERHEHGACEHAPRTVVYCSSETTVHAPRTNERHVNMRREQ